MVGTNTLIACALAVSIASAPAAGKGFSGHTLLDKDAGIVVRLEPGAVLAWLGRAAKTSAGIGAAKGGAGAASRFALGHDLTSVSGMRAAGLDPSKPAWVQVGAIDSTRADKVYQRLAVAKDWGSKFLRKTDRVFWRSRAVFAIKKRAAARSLAKKIIALSGDAVVVNSKAGPQLALLFGERTKRGPSIRAALAREGVVSAGWSKDLGAYIIARVTKRALIIDVVGTFAGVPLMWRRDRKRFLAAIKTAKKSRFELSSTGARNELRRGALVVWTDASSLVDRFRLLEQTQTLREIAVALPQNKRVAKRRLGKQTLACTQLETLARAGDLLDFALAVDDSAVSTRVALNWGIRPGSSYLQGIRFEDDGLRNPGGVASLQVFISDWRKFRGAKRTGLIAGNFAATRRALRRCPGGATSTVLLFGWPSLFAQFLDDLSATSPRAARLTGAMRNMALSVESYGRGLDSMKAVSEVSLERQQMPAVTALLDNVFGKSEQSLDLSIWGNGRLVPFRPRVKGRDRIGLALGRRSLQHYRESKGRAATAQTHALRFSGDARAASSRLIAISALAPLAQFLRQYRSFKGRVDLSGRRIQFFSEFQR